MKIQSLQTKVFKRLLDGSSVSKQEMTSLLGVRKSVLSDVKCVEVQTLFRASWEGNRKRFFAPRVVESLVTYLKTRSIWNDEMADIYAVYVLKHSE